MEPAEFEPLRGWIGRSETNGDVLTARLVRGFCATLDREHGRCDPGDPAPLGVHWCLAPPCVAASGLGPDGHPVNTGSFLPPVPLPRRMWAGGRLELLDRLRVGDVVERRSTVADIRLRQGRSGALCFVTMEHVVSTPRGVAIRERQDIVYRAAATAPEALIAPTPTRTATFRQPMRADPVLLFRYSALTFNGHRIHYDRPYARDVEAYRELVVHAPLQATWLLGCAESIQGTPTTFSFRGLLPLFDTDHFELCANPTATGVSLWVETDTGRISMEAGAEQALPLKTKT